MASTRWITAQEDTIGGGESWISAEHIASITIQTIHPPQYETIPPQPKKGMAYQVIICTGSGNRFRYGDEHDSRDAAVAAVKSLIADTRNSENPKIR